MANQKSHSAIIGDLEEEFSMLAESQGEKAAKRWYWKLILVSLPSFLKNRIYWSLAMFKNYFKIAFRNMHRNKLFAGINLLGLAVGMACFILIALWVQDELSYDKFHFNKDRLFLLTIEHPSGDLDYNVPYALAPILASEYPEIQHYTRILELGQTTCSFSYKPADGSQIMFYEDSVNLVDSSFFSMFSFPFIHGDPETALQNINSLVIREEIAHKYFGEKNPIGKKLSFNNQKDLIVTGVVQMPANSHLKLDFLMLLENDHATDWNWADPSYVLLEESSTAQEFQQKITASLNENYPQRLPGTFKVGILPIQKVHLGFGRLTYVYIFSIVATFILIIACVNYMNLSTASSRTRSREVGLRKVVGAKRTQLITQFLGESTLMSTSALLLSLLLVQLLLPTLNSLTDKNLILFLGRDLSLILFLIGLILMVGLVAGSYSALFLSASSTVQALRASSGFRSRRSVFRLVSVVGQFTISVLLIICTLMIFKQLNYIQSRPLGLKTEYVLQMRNNPTLLSQFYSLKRELLSNPRISQVTRAQAVPYNDDFKTSGLEWEGKDPDLLPNVRYSITDLDFFETFEMEIVKGRSFSQNMPGDRRNYVINQTAARYMGLEDPVGKPLAFWGQEGQIIGVVKDFHHVALHREIMPHVFTINQNFHSRWIKFIFIKISSENIPDTLRFIEHTALEIAPNFPSVSTFLDQGVADLYASEQKLGKILTTFAFLAIFISCLGILGLSAFTAEQRTKEIGIRKIMGSSAAGIVALLSKQFSRWILVANLIAWPIAYYAMFTWLQEFAYRTQISLPLFILAGVLSLWIASLPIIYQSFKAAKADPIESLRYE